MRLMRLMQLWQRLSTRERALAGAVAVALLLVLIRYGVVEPYIAYTAQIEEEVEQESERVAKMQRQRDRGSRVTKRVELLRQRFQAIQRKFVPGETSSLAAANLQDRIQTLATQSGLELVTTQVLRDEPVGEFRNTAVQVTLRGELPAFADFLAGVEYGDWLLTVSTLDVRGTYGIRARRIRRAGQHNALTITLQVGGIMHGAKPLTVAQEN